MLADPASYGMTDTMGRMHSFLNYKVQREIPERVFLTEEELRQVINKDFSIKRLERVRDLFVFCCFTGLSYSDVKTLTPEHFETDGNGRVWIKKKRVKTGVLFRVPLLPIPKLILDKYKGGDKLLPIVDRSSTDAYLKEVAELCGINKNISSHTARFTFATTVTITNRISLEVVSKMMGHTNTRMTSRSISFGLASRNFLTLLEPDVPSLNLSNRN